VKVSATTSNTMSHGKVCLIDVIHSATTDPITAAF
jgi:hypothetical protein